MKSYAKFKDYFESKKRQKLNDLFGLFFNGPAHPGKVNNPYKIIYRWDVLEFMVHHKDWYTFFTSNSQLALINARDSNNYPVLAYALAGDITLENYRWLLRQLSPKGIQSQSKAHFIEIAATFGSVQRLRILFNEYYDPTEMELQQGLFYSVYHNQQEMLDFLLVTLNKKREENNQPMLTLNSLRDELGNSLLHLAVIGGHSDMITRIGSYSNLITVRNKQKHFAIDAAVLSNNKQLVIQVANLHLSHRITVNYQDLVLVLIKDSHFLDHGKEMLSYLRQKQLNDTASLADWLIAAINARNEVMVNELLIDLPHYSDIDGLINHARFADNHKIMVYLLEERAARDWITKIMESIQARLRAYIFREDEPFALNKLAQDDGLSPGSYKKTNHIADAPRWLSECQTRLKALFYGSFFKEIKQLYKYLSIAHRDESLFLDKISLKRRELIRKIKRADIISFNQQIKTAINAASSFFNEDSSSVLDSIAPKLASSAGLIQTINALPKENNSDDETLELTEKQINFIGQFEKLFDQTYQLYKCLSTGSVIKSPDAVDKLADIAKTAAIGILPNVSVSAPMLGIPLPFSLSIPTGVAAAAAIDLLMYIRGATQQAKAERIGQFFDGWSPRARTNNIYECARFLAHRFRDQIERLTTHDSIPHLADIAVARIFSYAMKSRTHTQQTTSSERTMGIIGRKMISPFFTVGPEPAYRRKSLLDIAVDALITYKCELFNWDTDDQRYLNVDKRLLSKDDCPDWTVKGIFEHTGIRINGRSYKGAGQEVTLYGYAYASSPTSKREMDKELSRRGGMIECNDIPDFELQIKHQHLSL